ncbi:MAG: hypothetical protein P4L68_11385 [Methylovirgula sp.]|nr:hypothetical protein [Methylovirgula sp.]
MAFAVLGYAACLRIRNHASVEELYQESPIRNAAGTNVTVTTGT